MDSRNGDDLISMEVVLHTSTAERLKACVLRLNITWLGVIRRC